MKHCLVCLQSFDPAKGLSGIQLYCSSVCARIGYNRKRLSRKKPKPTLVKDCLHCLVSFTTKDKRQKYCSDRCNCNENRHKHKMGGNWVKAMERDRYQCRICSSYENLIVHHIDGTGERESPNHRLENLVVLCRGCHQKVHIMTYRLVNGVMVLDNPITKIIGYVPVVFLDQVVSPTMEVCKK